MKSSFMLLAFTSFSLSLGAFTCQKSSSHPQNPNDTIPVVDTVPAIDTVPVTVVFQDTADVDDAHLDYYYGRDGVNQNNTSPGGSLNELPIYTWTVNGYEVRGRALLRFNLDKIPDNAVITQAKLSLYGMPSNFASVSIPQGNYGDNGFLIQRVTSSWTESTATWNTQPTTTTLDQLTVAGSNSTWNYNVTDLNVTSLIKTMKSSNNYGFCIKLQSEAPYSAIGFLSSEYADSLKRPKLELTYTKQ